MRRTLGIAGVAVLAIVSLLAVGSVDAAQSREVFLAEGTTIGGNELEKGLYKLTWKRNGSKDSYLITLQRGGKRVATVDGHSEERSEKQDNHSLLFRSDGNGGRVLLEIRSAGKRQVIVIDS